VTDAARDRACSSIASPCPAGQRRRSQSTSDSTPETSRQVASGK
jgi:hypothetical protein